MATNVNSEKLSLILRGDKFFKFINIKNEQVVAECLLRKAKKEKKEISASLKTTSNFLAHLNVSD